MNSHSRGPRKILNTIIISMAGLVVVLSIGIISMGANFVTQTDITDTSDNLPEEDADDIIWEDNSGNLVNSDGLPSDDAVIEVLGENDTLTDRVIEVIDGDTVTLERLGTVRLIGVDTPETKDPRKGVECFGMEASKFTQDLLQGEIVRVELDDSQGYYDRYGRLLVYIFLEDGRFINKILIQDGYANEYTYSIPYRFQDVFKEAESQARTQSIGLWGEVCECDCRSCSELDSCEEAIFLRDECGCRNLDGDGDGKICESLCQ